MKRNQIRGLKLNASVARAEQERPTFLGGSDRLISFTRETIVKLFKNASRWSWQDNDFIYQNFISSLSQCCHCFWESRAFHNHSLDFDQHIITFVSPLKAFCFNRWCQIQLRNKLPAPIMSIMSLFPDQIVSTHHMDFLLWIYGCIDGFPARNGLTRPPGASHQLFLTFPRGELACPGCCDCTGSHGTVIRVGATVTATPLSRRPGRRRTGRKLAKCEMCI